MKTTRIDEVEQILSLLKRVSVSGELSVARHIALATRSKEIFHMSNKHFLELLEEYELEINFDEVVENPGCSLKETDSDEIKTIIDEASNLNELRESLFEDDNNNG